MKKTVPIVFVVVLAVLAAPGTRSAGHQVEQTRKPASAIPIYAPEVIGVWPHDPAAFTQGLVYHNGFLYESTGLNGQSTLRQVEIQTGRVLRKIDVAPAFFAEGIAIMEDRVYQLTWTSGKSFVYDLNSFAQVGERSYTGEGWGLTSDGSMLLLSDGSQQIRFLDPATFETTKTIEVLDNGGAVTNLNELEFAKGEIFANIWHDDRIVRINPATGSVLGWLDMGKLYPQTDRPNPEDVLNGIAYDAAADRFFITGKRWPKLFEVKLRQIPASCYIIRRIEFPIRKSRRNGQPPQERIALLDVCSAARHEFPPTIELRSNAPQLMGGRSRTSFDVVRFFETEQEAREYALSYGITDIELRWRTPVRGS